MSIPIPEYMKIRQFVINLTANSREDFCKIPSERELSQKFQVARGTVRRALQDMVREGYLVPKRGMGTFLNSHLTAKYRASNAYKAGIILSSGMLVNITPDYQQILTGIFRQFAGHNISIQLVNFAARDPQKTFQDLDAMGLDGLIWLHPNVKSIEIADYFFKRKDALVIVSAIERPSWKNLVLDDYPGALIKGTARIMAQAGAEIVFAGRNDEHPEVKQLYAAFESVFSTHGLQHPSEYSIAANQTAKLLPKLLQERKPKAIYAQGGEIKAVTEVLYRMSSMLPDSFTFLCQETPEITKNLPANITLLNIARSNHALLGEEAAKILLGIIEHKSKQPCLIKVPRIIAESNDNDHQLTQITAGAS